MSDPWADFRVKPPAPAAAMADAGGAAPDPWADFRPAKPEGPSKAFTGGILPFSIDEQGKGKFDTDAGIIGSIKRMVTTPGDVMTGKIDMNTEEGLGRALEMSAGMSPVPPSVRAGRLGVVEPKVAPPTSQALKEAADQGYTAVREMGVDYSPRAVTQMIGGVKVALEKDGILAELAPTTHSIINKFANPPEGAVVTVAGLEAARRAAGLAAKDFAKPAEQLAASRLIDEIDKFIAAADPRSVVAGPAAAAGETLVAARANSAAGKRSDSITGIEERADLRAAAANSGRNLDNTIRQRVADVVLDPKKSRGFNADEIAALEKVVLGDGARNALRNVGNMLGGGGGLGAIVAGGGAGAMSGTMAGAGIGALVGTAVPAVGALARLGQNAMARRALNGVDATTRMRSPLYADSLAALGKQPSDMLIPQTIMGGGGMTALNSLRPTDQRPPISEEDLMSALRQLLADGGA